MKKCSFLLMVFPMIIFAQEKKNLNQGIYWTNDFQFAMGLENVVADIISPENQTPLNANIGITSVLGFQPIDRIALGGGFRYGFINDRINLVYSIVQPKIYFGDNPDRGFVFMNYGFSINKVGNANSKLLSIGIGDQNPIGTNMHYYYSLFIENHRMNFRNQFQNNWYIGLNLGIGIHTRKVTE